MPRMRQRMGDIFIDSFFQYSVTMGGAAFVAGTETLVSTIPIQSDADFVCVHTMMETGVAGATNATRVTLLNGGTLVKLTDGATQRDLTNLVGGVPADCLFGTAERPYMWPLTHLFRANTPITFTIVGQGAPLIALNQRYVLGGFKVPSGTLDR